jgi:hypothetical protein
LEKRERLTVNSKPDSKLGQICSRFTVYRSLFTA